MKTNARHKRQITITICSFLLAYLLTFVFEGKTFYCLMDYYGADVRYFVFIPMIAHFIGLLVGGFCINSTRMAKTILLLGMLTGVIATIPFFFNPSFLWSIGLVVTGFAGGCAFSSWSFFWKLCIPVSDRLKSCAEILIFSNTIMIFIDVITVYASPRIGVALSILCIIVAIVISLRLPIDQDKERNISLMRESKRVSIPRILRRPLVLLVLFIVVITINSGFMYRIVNPAFEYLSFLENWYWAVPYIIVLLIILFIPKRINRTVFLYISIAMIMGAFICFMVLGRGVAAYLIIDTLMLGAYGITDLFWWSTIGELLEYTDRPGIVAGIGISANVLGVLIGEVSGIVLSGYEMMNEYVTVIALCVICITIAILPVLNKHLSLLLKRNDALANYTSMSKEQQTNLVQNTQVVVSLTEREEEVMKYILHGKSNKDIAASLLITENTVKTHARNIYSKYGVNNRVELISTLLNHEKEV